MFMRILVTIVIILTCNCQSVYSDGPGDESKKIAPTIIDTEVQLVTPLKKLEPEMVGKTRQFLPYRKIENGPSFSSGRLLAEFKDLILRYFPNVAIVVETSHLHATYKASFKMVRAAYTNMMPVKYVMMNVELPDKGGILVDILLKEAGPLIPEPNYNDIFTSKSGPHAYFENKFSSKYGYRLIVKVYYNDKISNDFVQFLNSFSRIVNNFETYLQ